MVNVEDFMIGSRESLSHAAGELDRLAAAPGGDGWSGEVRRALRESAHAVENHLHAVVRPEGTADGITREAPRLIPAIEQLEVGLAATLVRLWEEQRSGSPGDDAFRKRLHRLSVQMTHLANREFTLLYDSLNEPAGL